MVTRLLFYRISDDSSEPAGQNEASAGLVSGAISLFWQVTVSLIRLAMDLTHYSWVMFIYIATLVLTTFWVQDIYDHLMDLKIKQIQKQKDGDKILKRIKFTPMEPKDLVSDLVARTVIITIYLVICSLL